MHDCIVAFLCHGISGQVWIQVEQRGHVDDIKDSPKFQQIPGTATNNDILAFGSLDERICIRYKILSCRSIYQCWHVKMTDHNPRQNQYIQPRNAALQHSSKTTPLELAMLMLGALK